MELLYALLLAHFTGDFILQTDRAVKHKERYKILSPYLYLHIAIHFGLILLFSWQLSLWKIALLIAVSHYCIDLGKLYSSKITTKQQWPFFIDQILHLTVIFAVVFAGKYAESIQALFDTLSPKIILAYLFVSLPTSIIIDKCLIGWSVQSSNGNSLPQAGKIIGIVERLLILTFILCNQWAGIGFLITAKSVFRFNDLKLSDRKLTEYILIGTLLSFAIAIFSGLLVNL